MVAALVKQQGGKSGLGDWQMLLQECLCAILHHPLQHLPHEQEEQHCLLILLSGPGTPCCSLAPSTALGEHGAAAIGGQGPRPRHHQVSLGGAPAPPSCSRLGSFRQPSPGTCRLVGTAGQGGGIAGAMVVVLRANIIPLFLVSMCIGVLCIWQ